MSIPLFEAGHPATVMSDDPVQVSDVQRLADIQRVLRGAIDGTASRSELIRAQNMLSDFCRRYGVKAATLLRDSPDNGR